MATYRIVNMYRKSKAVKGIHYDSQDNSILSYRVDKRHSLLFGFIHYWDYGACNLRPEYLFSSVDKAKEAIFKVDKSKRVTILYKQRMKIRLSKNSVGIIIWKQDNYQFYCYRFVLQHYISRIIEERINYEQNRFTFIITLPDA